jgi:hypothetical protein
MQSACADFFGVLGYGGEREHKTGQGTPRNSHSTEKQGKDDEKMVLSLFDVCHTVSAGRWSR